MGSDSVQDEETDHNEEMEEDEESEGDSSFGAEDSDRSEYDEFAGLKWLEEMEGLVTCNGGSSGVATRKQIGYCEAKLIRRSQIRATFYDDMDEPSRDTSLVAFELFDRYGRLRTEIKEHPIRKGSGMWNKDFDTVLCDCLAHIPQHK